MKLAIFAFTRRGCAVARAAKEVLKPEKCRMFTMEKFGQPDFEAYHPPLAAFTGPVFGWADQLLFVGSTGMAVRAIAPWVRDKKTDPGVTVVDEQGKFVISLLSGHIGGANGLTRVLAAELNAVPVITTATDVNGKFSVDDWAARNGLHISSMACAKAVAAAILEGDIPLCSDFPVVSELPKGVIPGNEGPLGIYIGVERKQPFARTLTLTPKVLQLGIGCRRDTPVEKIEAAVSALLDTHPIRREAIAGVASIDLKAREPGLLEFCRKWALPVVFYSAQELSQVEGDFPASEFVKKITGVDNVCERAALMNADRIVIHKTAMDGVTVALAQKTWEVAF